MRTHLLLEHQVHTACGLVAFDGVHGTRDGWIAPGNISPKGDFDCTDDPWAPNFCKRCRKTHLWRWWSGEVPQP